MLKFTKLFNEVYNELISENRELIQQMKQSAIALADSMGVPHDRIDFKNSKYTNSQCTALAVTSNASKTGFMWIHDARDAQRILNLKPLTAQELAAAHPYHGSTNPIEMQAYKLDNPMLFNKNPSDTSK